MYFSSMFDFTFNARNVICAELSSFQELGLFQCFSKAHAVIPVNFSP